MKFFIEPAAALCLPGAIEGVSFAVAIIRAPLASDGGCGSVGAATLGECGGMSVGVGVVSPVATGGVSSGSFVGVQAVNVPTIKAPTKAKLKIRFFIEMSPSLRIMVFMTTFCPESLPPM